MTNKLGTRKGAGMFGAEWWTARDTLQDAKHSHEFGGKGISNPPPEPWFVLYMCNYPQAQKVPL